MDILKNYRMGVNLGGWLSQYGMRLTCEHLDTFVTPSDIERIAGWGMDHVRLPVDYPVLEAEGTAVYVDKCIQWCSEQGLNVIIDLHRAPGYSFHNLQDNSLFDDLQVQERFLDIWRGLSRRLEAQGDNVMYEILNEVVEPDSSRWNSLAKKAVEAIRELDEDRKLLIGSNNYSSVHTLKELEIFDDPNTIYTFHFYEPHLFTHQKAYWNESFRKYDQMLEYPGSFTNLEGFLKENECYKKEFERYVGRKLDKQLMLEDMKPVLEFMAATGKPVYCGEYGVIENAPTESRINWHRDFVDILKKLDIGRAVWTYKTMNFGLTDMNGDIVSDELVQIVSS
ncbi:MAG TPA: cellulase family glycosylhydrolase [Clostridia bacterium]|nr:cellulase family glycosylhydrolase [Clostridia bacterium]